MNDLNFVLIISSNSYVYTHLFSEDICLQFNVNFINLLTIQYQNNELKQIPGFSHNYSCSIFVYVPFPDEGECIYTCRKFVPDFHFILERNFIIIYNMNNPKYSVFSVIKRD